MLSDRREVGMNRPSPLGFYDELPPADGTSPYAGSTIPGPLGTVTDRTSDLTSVHHPTAEREAALDGSISLPFAVGGETYWLRRSESPSRESSHKESVPPSDAVAIIERAAVQHRENAPLLRLLETAASQLAGVHQQGTFVLERLRTQWAAAKVVESRPAPAPRPRAAAGAPPPAEVEEPVMAQAAALKEAAINGVPFCEECAREAAEEDAA
jgi:hypothetical protein